jgi:sigma-B regulation protein RsbU (phosphoserine phosphatase)
MCCDRKNRELQHDRFVQSMLSFFLYKQNFAQTRTERVPTRALPDNSPAQAFMDILIAEEDPISRRMLEVSLQSWGHRVLVTTDGQSAYEALCRENAPRLAIFDWMMPQLDGLTICRRLRDNPVKRSLYLILLTARFDKKDIVAGLESGVDDYITKPFDREELQARVNVGVRLVGLQQRFSERVAELEEALKRVKQLQGLLPICCYCKSIRNDDNYWQRVEEYIVEHSGARFSHGICPKCFETVIKSQLREQGVSMEGLNLDDGIVSE